MTRNPCRCVNEPGVLRPDIEHWHATDTGKILLSLNAGSTESIVHMIQPRNSSDCKANTSISTAVLLAAGTGSRLKPLTDDAPKCLSEVSGVSILQRLIQSLCEHDFKRLVIVVGYLDHRVREFLDDSNDEIDIELVINPRYATTNNLYSLWLARQTIDEPCLLLESDVVFDSKLLLEMLHPDRMAVSRMLPWMNGTTVTVDTAQHVTAFQFAGAKAFGEIMHKTVNMYSFSRETWRRFMQRLSSHVTAGRVNEYYETVLAEMLGDGSIMMDAVPFDKGRWYEIDTLEDLQKAELMFPAELSAEIINTPLTVSRMTFPPHLN
ncbi:NTP transferase domain-containing protein [Stieleria marina]|uniref:Bifunctional IPC transferase and DIPP synthase n=1 Tax=Stieleria marina TaxID=1930275 RepID=A0A517NPG6_9BACT|nr:Bifunctional IPC transferase and DIPP synthase [Planctomycetes bacterium K23_9]